MNAERLLEHYEKIADAPDAVARLRTFILDLAVRGKLVPQDREDETASELLKRIAQEKAQLVRAGEIRELKSYSLDQSLKSTSPIGWKIVPLGDVVNRHLGGGTPSKTDARYWGGNIRWASVKDVGKTKYLDDTTDRITEEGLKNSSSNLIPPGNLIVVTRMGLGQLSINRVPVAINQDLRALFLSSFVDIDFAYSFFLTHRLDGTGLTVKGIKLDELLSIPFPFPPLSEQRRIVAKIDELMALCDQLEAARTERETTRDQLAAASLARLNSPDPETFRDDARFALGALSALTARSDQIKQLRQTLLNLAVRGKLVAQDPTDEPAAELLLKVAVERKELVRAKTIRREAPLDAVLASDPPYQVPNSWVWGRVGDAVLFTQYGTSQKSHVSENGVPVLTMGNIQDGRVVWGSEKRIPQNSEDLPALYLRRYDLLYNRTNSAELVGKTGIYLGEDEMRTFASYLIRLGPSLRYSNPRYLNIAMNAPIFRETQIVPLIKKQTGQANVSGSALKNMLIPIPPLAEQHRIVAKVDELMALCDQLDASLTTADKTRRKLLDALLAEALAPVNAKDLQEAAE